MNTDGKLGWEEIVDSSLDGKFNSEELNDVAALAYTCVNRSQRKRPSMRDTVQILSRIPNPKHNRHQYKHSLVVPRDDISINMDQPVLQSPKSDCEHLRRESMDSTTESCDV